MCRPEQRQDTSEQQLFTHAPSFYKLPAPGNHHTTEAPTAGTLNGLHVLHMFLGVGVGTEVLIREVLLTEVLIREVLLTEVWLTQV